VTAYPLGCAKTIAVYDTASNCLNMAYKQDKNNFSYIPALQQYWPDAFLQYIISFMLRIIFKSKKWITFW